MKNTTMLSLFICICLVLIFVRTASATVLVRKQCPPTLLGQVKDNSGSVLSKSEAKTSKLIRKAHPPVWIGIRRLSGWLLHAIRSKHSLVESACFQVGLMNGDLITAKSYQQDRDSIRIQYCEGMDSTWHTLPLTAIKQVVGLNGKIIYTRTPRKFEILSLVSFLSTILAFCLFFTTGVLLFFPILALTVTSFLTATLSLTRISEHPERYKLKVLSIILSTSSMFAIIASYLLILYLFFSYSGK